MLKNEDIICISSIDWDFIWQGHQEIMTRLARNGNRVLFIENTGVRAPRVSDFGRIRKRIANWRKGVRGIRKIEDGLYVYSPIVLPFPYLRIARFINKKLISSVLFRWLKSVGFSEPIVWTFLPTALSLDIIEKIEPKALIYYCIDSFKASSKGAEKIRKSEERLIKRSDIVFVTSDELARYCRQYNDRVHYFPFGVSIENFQKAFNQMVPVPADMVNIKRPIAGYIGGIHKWIDLELVEMVADALSDVSFVFCGPIQTDVEKLKKHPNITFLGYKPTEELPMYVKEFDVALIPYRITEYTRNVYPTKLNEYLSVGKRVVSTNLPEVVKFNRENGNIVSVSSSAQGFCDELKTALSSPRDPNETARAIEAAKKNSWASKLEEMSSLIESILEEKRRIKEVSWRSNLANIYRRTGKRFAIACVAIAYLYFALFHTPLIWWVASPLAVKSEPEISDAIVVLGAGTGESGKAGQGYEERVYTAVKLYKEGLAGRIIYISGYKYIMREAHVMKALSVSIGVSERDVMVDDSPSNTYDMIKSLAAMARSSGWKSIILVSSPYHMLRVKLLCDRYLSDVKFYFVPVEQSAYYSKGHTVKLEQIKGILHEYAAIVYYKFKYFL
ncbi:MAG: YdcF family protein [Candidatus Omnitrophica bacterium]|nr:YdcF family protein [Candidatus Omnitrophota bacterium]